MAGVAYEVRPTLLAKGDPRKKEYQRVNPMKTVPAMEHGQLAIGESLAILRYLAKMAKNHEIFPYRDQKKNLEIEKFFCYYHRKIRPIFRLAFGQAFAKLFGIEKFFNLEDDLKLVEKILKAFEAHYISKGKKFILGEKLTVCDLVAACEIMQLNVVKYPLEEKFKPVFDWLMRCKAASPELVKGHFYWNKMLKSKGIESWMA
jgi:glutathione S-transferase